MKKLTHIYENNQWILVGEVNQYDLDLKITKGTLGTINGISIEDGNNVNLDLCPYIIVEELPENFDEILKNKIYILISKTPVNFPNAIFDEGTYDNVSYTDRYLPGFFDNGRYDIICYQMAEDETVTPQPEDPSVNPEPLDPSVTPLPTSWRFGVNNTFPIILGGGNTVFGASSEIFGALPVVEHASDGHYIFHVSNEKQKIGYWQKLNDNTFEVKLNDYLSLIDATKLYQPKGDYMTPAQVAESYLKVSTAQSLYQPKGNYLTIQSAINNYQTKGNYVTENNQTYYLNTSIYAENTVINLYTKSENYISSLTLQPATEEKSGLMAASDKQTIRELHEQLDFVHNKVRRLLQRIPGIFDTDSFDECCYQDTVQEDEEFDSIGTFIVYKKNGNNAEIKQVYTYQYNSNSGLTNTITATESELNAAILELRLSINPNNLLDDSDYIFINNTNETGNVLLSDIESSVSPKFKIKDGNIYYKNEFGTWTLLTSVDNIHSLQVINEITFEIDENSDISYSTQNPNITIDAQIDKNGHASVFLR